MIKQHQTIEKSMSPVLKWLVAVSLPAPAEAENPPALHLVSVQSSELQPSEQLDQESWGEK